MAPAVIKNRPTAHRSPTEISLMPCFLTHQIGRPSIRGKGRFLICEARVEIAKKSPKQLRFKLSREYSSWISCNGDAFLIAILIPAMLEGGEIIVDADLSDVLLWRTNTVIQDYLIQALPMLKRVLVRRTHPGTNRSYATKIAASILPPARVIGFSCGVDSFSTLWDLHLSAPSKNTQITHLVFNDCGSHGSDPRLSRRLRKKRLQRVQKVAQSLKLPVIEIRTNITEFYQSLSFRDTFSLRNAACALVLQARRVDFTYSAAHNYQALREADALSQLEPFILPLLSSGGLRLGIGGYSKSRPEKIEVLSRLKLTHHLLDVCTNPSYKRFAYPNCGICAKCFHTLAVLDAIGSIDAYKSVFDLNAYYMTRDQRLASLSEASLLGRTAYNYLVSVGFLSREGNVIKSDVVSGVGDLIGELGAALSEASD